MTPTATKKGSRLYRYYASMDLIRNRPIGESAGPLRLPAGMVEDAVIGEIRRMIRAPEIAARVLKMLREESPTVDEKATQTALAETPGGSPTKSLRIWPGRWGPRSP